MHVALDCSHSIASTGHGVASYIFELVRALARVSTGEDRFDLGFKTGQWTRRARGVPEIDARFRHRRIWWLPFRFSWARQVQVFHALAPTPLRTPFPRQVVTIHDAYPLLGRLYGDGPPSAVRSKRIRLLHEAARRADALICPSESTRRDVLELLPGAEGKAVVIPQGIDHDLLRKVPRHEEMPSPVREAASEPFILHLGSLAAIRNLPATVRAFARVANELPRARLLIAGPDTAHRKVIEQEIRESGLEDRVLMLGLIQDNEKRFLLASARGLVMFHLHAGFGLPALEAMAVGTPVGLSRRGGLPEVGGDAALYADEEDAADMAGVMLALLSDEDRRRFLSEAGRARAAAFSWEATARSTYELYKRLIG